MHITQILHKPCEVAPKCVETLERYILVFLPTTLRASQVIKTVEHAEYYLNAEINVVCLPLSELLYSYNEALNEMRDK